MTNTPCWSVLVLRFQIIKNSWIDPIRLYLRAKEQIQALTMQNNDLKKELEQFKQNTDQEKRRKLPSSPEYTPSFIGTDIGNYLIEWCLINDRPGLMIRYYFVLDITDVLITFWAS